MIVINRDLARTFRAVAQKCLAGRPRGPASPVLCQARAGTLTLWTWMETVGLAHIAPTPGGDETLVVPMAVLGLVEGTSPDPVELVVGPKLRGSAQWTQEGVPRTTPFEALLPGRQHAIPEPPVDLTLAPAQLLTALHECGRTAARDSGGRFDLTKVQLQGSTGRVVGTDSQVALLWNGFPFPFPDDFLIPAIPVFGSKPLVHGGDVSVGRTATHLVVVIGPWSVWLPTDTLSRFPDVAGIVPRCAPTTAGIDEQDAAAVLKALPGLPGADQENRPVTLDADRVVRVRARDDSSGAVKELTLIRSPTAGPAAQVVLDRRVLARLLALGCHTLHLTPDKPLSADGDGFTLVVAVLDSALAVPPSEDATKALTDAEPDQGITRSTPNPERNCPMKLSPTNGHGATDRPDPPGPAGTDQPDPLFAAEELRVALADATAKATRLVAALRHAKKEKKALASVWAGLKSLNLGNGGG